MRSLLASSALALLLWMPTSVGAEGAKPAPRNLRELAERLQDLAKRVDALKTEANKDPDEALIDQYANYTLAQLKKTRGRVRAEDVLGFMLDPNKHLDVRQKAFKALYDGALFKGDPDLSKTEKQGSKSKRAYFSEKYLVKELDNDDRIARKLANDLLMQLWFGRQSRIPEIDRYNAADDKTWRAADKKWRQFLKRN